VAVHRAVQKGNDQGGECFQDGSCTGQRKRIVNGDVTCGSDIHESASRGDELRVTEIGAGENEGSDQEQPNLKRVRKVRQRGLNGGGVSGRGPMIEQGGSKIFKKGKKKRAVTSQKRMPGGSSLQPCSYNRTVWTRGSGNRKGGRKGKRKEVK